MTHVAQAHQWLCQRYSTLMYVDVMIPHTYTPLQTLFLTLVSHEKDLKEDPHKVLLEHLGPFLLDHNRIKLEEVMDELMGNPLLLAWMRDFFKGLSPQEGESFLKGLKAHFPFHNASLNMLRLVLKSLGL